MAHAEMQQNHKGIFLSPFWGVPVQLDSNQKLANIMTVTVYVTVIQSFGSMYQTAPLKLVPL